MGWGEPGQSQDTCKGTRCFPVAKVCMFRCQSRKHCGMVGIAALHPDLLGVLIEALETVQFPGA